MNRLAPVIGFLVMPIVFAFSSPAFSGEAQTSPGSTMDTILKRGKLIVGLTPGYVPLIWQDEKGNLVGFDVDMAKEMAKAMNVGLDLVSTPWADIIPALIAKKFDIIMSGMTITQERNLQVNFSDPYIVAGQTVLLGKQYAEAVKSCGDLNDQKYTVTSMSGSTGEQTVKRLLPKAAYRPYPTQETAALAVLNGQASAFVYDWPYCASFYAQRGREKLIFLDTPLTYEPLAWAVRKGDPDFLNWLNHFLRQVKNDGRYLDMYNRWLRAGH
jgi:polar amino acid transport system substrate-binding protein